MHAALAEDFRILGERLFHTRDVTTALGDLVHLARQTIPFCDWAGITQVTGRDHNRFTTIAATDPVVVAADELQYLLRQGPCVEAARVNGLFQADDLRTGNDWPEFGVRVTATTPIRSALSLTIHPAPGRAALNLYSCRTHVFLPSSVDIATVFGAHAQVLLMLTRQTDKVVNLDRALTTSRLIGNAVGILMYAHRISADDAFDRLRAASSHLNRKLTDIATEVTETGQLPPRDRPAPLPGTGPTAESPGRSRLLGPSAGRRHGR